MTDINARIAALMEQGVELPAHWGEFRPLYYDGEAAKTVHDQLLDEALTVIERQREEIAESRYWEGLWFRDAMMRKAIGAARLKLAEQELSVFHRVLGTPISGHFDEACVRGRIAEITHIEASCYGQSVDYWTARAEKAEAALAAERVKYAMEVERCEVLEARVAAERSDPKKGEWKRKYFQARADLAAEREKRCATCKYEPQCSRLLFFDPTLRMGLESCSRWIDAQESAPDFGCTEWQQREATT